MYAIFAVGLLLTSSFTTALEGNSDDDFFDPSRIPVSLTFSNDLIDLFDLDFSFL